MEGEDGCVKAVVMRGVDGIVHWVSGAVWVSANGAAVPAQAFGLGASRHAS